MTARKYARRKVVCSVQEEEGKERASLRNDGRLIPDGVIRLRVSARIVHEMLRVPRSQLPKISPLTSNYVYEEIGSKYFTRRIIIPGFIIKLRVLNTFTGTKPQSNPLLVIFGRPLPLSLTHECKVTLHWDEGGVLWSMNRKNKKTVE